MFANLRRKLLQLNEKFVAVFQKNKTKKKKKKKKKKNADFPSTERSPDLTYYISSTRFPVDTNLTTT